MSVNKKGKGKARKQDVRKKSDVISFIRSERTRFLLGVCFVFVALYILIGMVSFFFTGAADQSKVMNKNFLDLITHKQEIDNWTGVSGAFIAELLINKYFGIFSFVIPVFLTFVGARLMGLRKKSLIRPFLISSFILIWGSIFSSFLLTRIFPDSHVVWGGSHGFVLEQLLENTLGYIGVVLVILLLLAIFVIITKKTSIHYVRRGLQTATSSEKEIRVEVEEDADDDSDSESGFGYTIKKFVRRVAELFRSKSVDEEDTEEDTDDDKSLMAQPQSRPRQSRKIVKTTHVAEPQDESSSSIVVEDDFEIIVPSSESYSPSEEAKPNFVPNSDEPKYPLTSVDGEEDFSGEEEMEEYDPTKDLSNFHFPSTELLRMYETGGKGVDMQEQKENKEKIINTLRNYGIEITSIKATVGPTITLYEIVPQAGVRISKIRNLEDDIALSLSALGIRIIAPMPGKGTIGIEVPNKDPQIVSMQSVIASNRFQECTYDLPVALGKTITNEIFMFDLCKMPHLLVAGATGQGKSVGLNAIITSLLYKKHPAEMKMVLVDPKMVEFNIYSTIEKHYLAKLPDAEKAIITDVTKVTQTLNSLTKEMDDRYELLMAASVRNIKEYNEKFRKRRLNPLKGHRFLPYIVVIIDEFGDLIMTAGKEIEMPIARIAQKARAVGIHMIIATQRPTTNIITGTIKANFPARMAFRVTSQIDSRTILDMSGANQLIGRGDMLFSQGSDLVRIQCAFVDTPEVEGITQYISHQQGYASAFELPEFVADGGGDEKIGNIDLSDRDPLFEEAARLIVVHQQGSTSLIQRKFSIGYNRAGRLMDQLEAAGIVGPVQGSKPRDVMVTDEYSLEQKLSSL